MEFIDIYINLIRLLFIILTIYYLFKRDFKKIKATIVVFVLSFLLSFLDRFFNLQIDLLGKILYFLIISMSVYLGGALKFYDKYAWWDRVLHFLSGVLFVSFGIAMANKMEISTILGTLFFSFTLSTALHAIWEVGEYIIDRFAHTDHQRWQKHNDTNNHLSEKAIQPAGLVDTMNDIIVCMVGTIIACFVWWFIL